MNPTCKHCSTPMVDVMGGHTACVVCGHVLKGPCECPGCTGGEVPKAGHYFCGSCYRLVPIRVDTEGTRYVWHSCPAFKGEIGERKEFESTCGAKVTLFPSDEDPPDFPEGFLRQRLEEIKKEDEDQRED